MSIDDEAPVIDLVNEEEDGDSHKLDMKSLERQMIGFMTNFDENEIIPSACAIEKISNYGLWLLSGGHLEEVHCRLCVRNLIVA